MAKNEYETATVQQLLARLVELLEGGTSGKSEMLGPKMFGSFNTIFISREGWKFVDLSEPEESKKSIPCPFDELWAQLTDVSFDLERTALIQGEDRPNPKIFFRFKSRKPAGDPRTWDLSQATEDWNGSICSSIYAPEIGGLANSFTRILIFNLGAIAKANPSYLRDNYIILSVEKGSRQGILPNVRFYNRATGAVESVSDILGKPLNYEGQFKQLGSQDPVWYAKAAQLGALLRGETDTYGGSPAAQQPEPQPAPEGGVQ